MLTIGNSSLPLYVQVTELVVAKISQGKWPPGKMIPSEIQLARELGISQGTVRKAISGLVESNVLTRRQGRGTFVSNHGPDRSLFHFFQITDNDGRKVIPDSRVLHCRRRPATKKEAAKLQLAEKTLVIRIERVRNFSATPTMLETITLPESLFNGLGKDGNRNLPNTLYELYEKEYGITIHRADEELRAVAATQHDAAVLKLKTGAPLLEIERVALTLDRTPVELRISRCSTKGHYYQNTCF